MQFSVASFNIKNLIGPEKEYYRFQSYTPEEYAWKRDWTADQMLDLDADIIGFQEVFEEEALRDVVALASHRAETLNAAVIPDRGKAYRRKVIFDKLGVAPWTDASLAFAPNSADAGVPGERRPGVAVLSRLGFVGAPEIIQDLATPFTLDFQPLRGMDQALDAGQYTLHRLSRPILKVRVPVGDQVITVFNCHLKSKLGEFITPPGAPYAREEDLTRYDPLGRAMGAARAEVRRVAEALVLRREIVAELNRGHPVIAVGDFNDGEHAVSAEIIEGETPFRNYSWMLRHDAQSYNDRYSPEEHEAITAEVKRLRLTSAEALFVARSLKDMVFTSAFAGVYESIDRILLSRHFHPDNPDRIADLDYVTALNDHITDGLHPEAPYNKLASDHGQIKALLRLRAA